MGYSNSVESDILLLDISNNKNYTWTYHFDPSENNHTQQSDGSSNNIPVILIGIIIGSLSSCALVTFGSFFLYSRWNKNSNKDMQQNTVAIDYFY